MSPITVRLANASKDIGHKTLWANLNASFHGGEVVLITGESGCGKTTMLQCLAGLSSLSSGEIFFNDQQLGKLSRKQRRGLLREEIGFLFQDYALVPEATVQENLSLVLPLWQRKRRKQTVINQVLTQVGLDPSLAKQPVYALSGGEQQRVAMARLALRKPKLILADEPTAALDRKNAANILQLLQERAAQDQALVVVVSHDPWVEQFCTTKLAL